MPFLREFATRIRRSAFPKTNAFPPIALQGKKVLDLGCGRNALTTDGATIIGLDAFAFPRPEALGKITFVRGTMERLPFVSSSFDFVSARNALYYSHMPTTLSEVRRVLRPGGTLWGTLAVAPEAATRLVSSLLTLRLREAVYMSYSFANGLLTAATGKQMRWINRKRCESVNTCVSIRRLLRDAGFEKIFAQYHDFQIIFSAQKILTVAQ
jgi:ubiquinone/menaquinone biosynthesis C-methylase UbiE